MMLHPTKTGISRLACAAVMILSLLLSACGGIGLPTAKPVTITFSFPQSDKTYYETLLPKLSQQNPNITIELKPLTRGPDQPVDVSILDWSFLMSNQEQLAANSLSLDSFIDQDKSFDKNDYYPGTLQAFTIDGKILALPTGVDPWVMYYNQDLFDQMNVPYPTLDWTWNDFLSRAQSLRNFEAKTYGYAPSEGYVDSIFFVYQHGGNLIDSSGKPTLTDPLTLEALEWYASLYLDHNVAPTQDNASADFGAGRNGANIGIVSGKIGMWPAPLSQWNVNAFDNIELKFKRGIVPLPRDSQKFTIAFFEGVAISSKTADPDACWKWVSFLNDQIHPHMLPARVSLAESDAYQQLVGVDIAQAARAALQGSTLVSRETWGDFTSKIDVYFAGVNQIINDGVPVQEAMEKVQQQLGQ